MTATWSRTISGTALAGSLAAVLVLGTAVSASAYNKPSEAQQITLGVAYFGDTGSADSRAGDVWRLPPLIRQDVVTIAASADPGPAHIPVGIGANVDDYDYLQSWQEGSTVYGGTPNGDFIPGGRAARLRLQNIADCSDCFLEFGVTSNYFIYTGSYQFTVESIQRALGLGLSRVSRLSRKGNLVGSARLANGLPAPDGVDVSLVIRRSGSQIVRSAVTQAGALRFSLGLPKSFRGKRVAVSLRRVEDQNYQAASTAPFKVRVT